MSSKSHPENSNSASSGPREEGSQPLSAEQLLPAVEPPSAGFILQLFVVPGLIVLAVFLLVSAIGWMRSAQEDPLAKVEALRRGNQARWQQAFELAQMLMKEGDDSPALKENAQLAKEIALLLKEELDAANTDENSISLRYYLCRILGEFRVDEGVGVLLEVARIDGERDVRREAVNAMAVLGDTYNSMEPPRLLAHPKLVESLVELASDQDDLIRSQVAYALGVIALQEGADERLLFELEKLVDDLYADARFNAALGLARRGNLRAVDALTEMFDPQAIEISIANEKTAALQAFKRNTILKNALEATGMLLAKNPQIALPEVTQALRRFVESASDWQEPAPVPADLVERAQALLEAAAQEQP